MGLAMLPVFVAVLYKWTHRGGSVRRVETGQIRNRCTLGTAALARYPCTQLDYQEHLLGHYRHGRMTQSVDLAANCTARRRRRRGDPDNDTQRASRRCAEEVSTIEYDGTRLENLPDVLMIGQTREWNAVRNEPRFRDNLSWTVAS